MYIIKHRVTSFEEIPPKFHVEIDVHDHNGILVVSHDLPNPDSQSLEIFLKHFPKDKFLAINVKTCGIEKKLSYLLNLYSVNYFAFDFSIPCLLDALNQQIVCALRLSEYEKEIFEGPQWIWLDSFHSIWFDEKYVESLKNKGFQISVVSPELHGRINESDFIKIKYLVKKNLIDAICTKFPDMWI